MFFSARWNAGCSGRCEQVHCRGEAATVCPATTLVSSHALNEAKAAGSLCRLADWSSGPVARTHCRLTVEDASDIEERDQHDFDFWFWLSCFVRSRRRRRLPLIALALGFRVLLDDVLTHLHAALLLTIIQQPWHHFCADFPEERSWGVNKKHVKQNSVVAQS